MRRYLEPLRATNRDSWVSGLGHGVLPATPENMRLFIKIVRDVMQ